MKLKDAPGQNFCLVLTQTLGNTIYCQTLLSCKRWRTFLERRNKEMEESFRAYSLRSMSGLARKEDDKVEK